MEKNQKKISADALTAADRSSIQENLAKFVERTNQPNPNPEDLALLEKVFDSMPSLHRSNGNLQKHIFDEIFKNATAHSAFIRSAAERRIEEMKTELGYETSTFLEQMLIDEVLMRWLRLQVSDREHKNTTNNAHSVSLGMYAEKRLHLAQKRYLRSVETLSKVRKMIGHTQAKAAKMYKNLMSKDD